MVMVDGGTTNHILKYDAYLSLRATGSIPLMTSMVPGEMSITFGEESNQQSAIGVIENSSLLGPIYVVNRLDQAALISEKEFAKHGGIILKDNVSCLIIINNALVLHAVRDPDAPEGSNRSLWLADLRELFNPPVPLPKFELKSAYLKQLLIDVRLQLEKKNKVEATSGGCRTTPVVLSPPHNPLSSSSITTPTNPSSVIDINCSNSPGLVDVDDDGHVPVDPRLGTGGSHSAKPTYTQGAIRAARQAIWASGGSAYRLADVLEAHALDNPPSIPPRLLRDIGDKRDNPTYRMTHDVQTHPGGSGIGSPRPGEKAHADIFGKWTTDKGVQCNYAIMVTDEATLWTKVYALDTKTTVKDALVLYANELAVKHWILEDVLFDHASEVSEATVMYLNKSLALPDSGLIPIPSATPRETLGIKITKAGKEVYEKTVEAHWRSVRKDMAYALMNQNHLPQQKYWFWAFKHTAELGNGFLNSKHPFKTPFEQIYGSKPDATRILSLPFGKLGVCTHVKGNASGLDRVLAPAYDLAILIGIPLEIPNNYLVLLPQQLRPTLAVDMRPLDPEELQLTNHEWTTRALTFDANGRIIGVPSTHPPEFTLEGMIRQFESKRFQAQSPEQAEALQQSTLAAWKGRLRSGGNTTNKTARELSGRELRSDRPIRPHQLSRLVLPPTTDGGVNPEATSGDRRIHPVVHTPPLIPLPLILDPPIPPVEKFPVPTSPYTFDHPEILRPKAVARIFDNPVSGEKTIYQGLPAYYLPPQSTAERGMFRIHYHDLDFEDLSLTDLHRYQEAFKTHAKIRKDQQDSILRLNSQRSTGPPSSQLDSVDAEEPDNYWSSTNSATNNHQRISANHAFRLTYEGAPTFQDLQHLQSLTTLDRDVTTADITECFNPFEVDEESDLEAIASFKIAFGHYPTKHEQHWLEHISSLLSTSPSPYQLRTAAAGPTSFAVLLKSLPQRTASASMATSTYDKDNPSTSMVHRDPELQEIWYPLIHAYNKDKFHTGQFLFKTLAQAKEENIKLVRHLVILKTKHDNTKKVRHTPDEQAPKSDFEGINLFAGGIPFEALKAQIAHGTWNGLVCEFADHIDAFGGHNWWDDPANKRTRRVGTILKPWETGLDHDIVAQYQTVKEGFRDAPAVWSAIQTRSLLKSGLQRSAVYKDFYFIHTLTAILTLVMFVDDSSKWYTDSPEGEALHQQVMDQLNKDNLPMKIRKMVPEGQPFLGLHIQPFSNDRGKGMAVSQRIQGDTNADLLTSMGFDPSTPTYNPHFKTWSQRAAVDPEQEHTINPERTTRYLRLLGSISYQMITGQTSPMVNLLAKYSNGPNAITESALIHVGLHHQTVKHIPLTFYQSPTLTDTTTPTPFHCFTDAGEDGSLDGGGRAALALKLGPHGHPGGAFHTVTKSVPYSPSTPADELYILGQAVGFIMVFRYLFQELSGHHPDPYNMEQQPAGANLPPTTLVTPHGIGEDILQHDVGTLGCPVNTLLHKYYRQRLPSLHPPTWVGQDNLTVQEMAMSDGEISKLKNSRPSSRILRGVFAAVKDYLITVAPIPSPDNHVNPLTKIPTGPLSHSRGMEGLLGYSDQLVKYVALLEKRWRRSRKPDPNAMVVDNEPSLPECLEDEEEEILTTQLPPLPTSHTHPLILPQQQQTISSSSALTLSTPYSSTDMAMELSDTEDIFGADDSETESTSPFPPAYWPNPHSHATTRNQGVHQEGLHDEDPVWALLVPHQMLFSGTTLVDMGDGVVSARAIPNGQPILEYTSASGKIIRGQEAMEEEHRLNPTDTWFKVASGRIPMFIQGDCLAAKINHACGRSSTCPANAQLQRDTDGRVWVTAVQDIPANQPILLDYNFDEAEKHSISETQAWWRSYICPICSAGNVPIHQPGPMNVGRIMPYKPPSTLGPDGISNAAWMRRATPGGLACMKKSGFTDDYINKILWDEDPDYSVFRPFSKYPPNKRGLGMPDPPPSLTRIKPPLIIRAYMATFSPPVSSYTLRYAALNIPRSEAMLPGMLRPYNALLASNTKNNSNKPFRNRMLELLREGQHDAISVWNINTPAQLAAHDKLCAGLKVEQTLRQQMRQTNKPSTWKIRRAAEQSRRPSLHHFAAVSDSGTWCVPPSSIGMNPVVPLPLPPQPPTILPSPRTLPPGPSLPLGGLPFPNLSSLAPSNTFLASSHNIPASSNPPPLPAPFPSQHISHPAKTSQLPFSPPLPAGYPLPFHPPFPFGPTLLPIPPLSPGTSNPPAGFSPNAKRSKRNSRKFNVKTRNLTPKPPTPPTL